MEQYDISLALCNRGLAFRPEGIDAAKLRMRKAQAMLDRPQHSDPDAAVLLLQQALDFLAEGDIGARRPVLELLKRARKAAKDRQKEADAALRGKLTAPGGGLRLADAKAEEADARHEIEQLLRRGYAHLFGTHADKASTEMLLPREHSPDYKPPVKDTPAAGIAFDAAFELAETKPGLRQEAAHALFGKGAVASDFEQWDTAANNFTKYFEIEAELAGAELPFQEPVLGACYAWFHCGMAHYSLRRVEPTLKALECYLGAAKAFKQTTLSTTDAWGNDIITPLDKAVQAARDWLASERSEYSARRMLATVYSIQASRDQKSGDADDPVISGHADKLVTNLHAMLPLASEDEQRREVHADLARVLSAFGREAEATEHAETASKIDEALERRKAERKAREVAADMEAEQRAAATEESTQEEDQTDLTPEPEPVS